MICLAWFADFPMPEYDSPYLPKLSELGTVQGGNNALSLVRNQMDLVVPGTSRAITEILDCVLCTAPSPNG